MSELLLKSPHDGSTLLFVATARDSEETCFDVVVRTPAFSGRAPASTIHNGSPARMFRAMAQEWKGWSGEKHWEDLEKRVSISAQSDTTGHVCLVVDLTCQNYETRLHAVLQFEAGQLDTIATDLESFFGPEA